MFRALLTTIFGTMFRAPFGAALVRPVFLSRLLRLGKVRALFFFWQADSPVRVFVNLATLLHLSRELHERAPPRVAQFQCRRDLAQALRPAGPREMRYDLGFGDRFSWLFVAWHGSGHCMRSSGKTRSP